MPTLLSLYKEVNNMLKFGKCALVCTYEKSILRVGSHCYRSSKITKFSQLIPFARASSHVAEFNTGNTLITQKFLKQG